MDWSDADAVHQDIDADYRRVEVTTGRRTRRASFRQAAKRGAGCQHLGGRAALGHQSRLPFGVAAAGRADETE